MITAVKSPVRELTDEIIAGAAGLMKDGPSITSVEHLRGLCDLLAIQLSKLHRPLARDTRPERILRHLTDNRVRRTRSQNGFTLDQLSDASRIATATIENAERGGNVTLLTMISIGSGLNTPAADLWPALRLARMAFSK